MKRKCLLVFLVLLISNVILCSMESIQYSDTVLDNGTEKKDSKFNNLIQSNHSVVNADDDINDSKIKNKNNNKEHNIDKNIKNINGDNNIDNNNSNNVENNIDSNAENNIDNNIIMPNNYKCDNLSELVESCFETHRFSLCSDEFELYYGCCLNLVKMIDRRELQKKYFQAAKVFIDAMKSTKSRYDLYKMYIQLDSFISEISVDLELTEFSFFHKKQSVNINK
ncbi:hypothetical protein DICPUDRAFT_82962 [Dictyostelium purpureum]|uniref:Uncharacterized protein n=1 Tax=Dictyostelium purpureum TaxID=5786 RepID=F0ZY51_DICPU|nr:uncharacterized protein DICPUDRAFT_82962 [Dictyostelium purpureum]EGC31123.1 hypothetical protein DICPUDRAFT_82962 [Dictyostelium purpureum]|eukprot:XP_003292341.1 hypothetical protein DICPUDRAFT_82962 [Dictyostelium purpureum]